MNIYGDRGNILCLERRCRERGIALQVAEDLVKVKGKALREASGGGVAVLAVCGGYQLLGRYYRTAEGEELPGVGLFGLWTEHPGPGAKRFIGNVVVEWRGGGRVGVEKQRGRTPPGGGGGTPGRGGRGVWG